MKLRANSAGQHDSERTKPKYSVYSYQISFQPYLCQEVRFRFRDIFAKKQDGRINLSSMKTL